MIGSTTYSPPLAERSLRRQTPTLGAVCVNRARTDPCGGAQQRASLVRCGLFGEDNISSSSKESGEPHASLRSKNLCGRYGPASPSSAVHAGRYPGTRLAADPVYKVARRG